ncbi:preprotein translocase subunit SecG [Cytophaga hutchinsonii]|jgi:preprotein translocase subunit SecG|uniref:Protein-export membrane protein SecG n=1 Tax=Cytophaga hutchinsonii (strain ATCC 33406 / DSM 1761 / CIP 103989 / NBRC 15051 / NCIMB 9469 / D465) TaxID=269798 RepID=A0A6N4SRV6_CYTH3|nr:preprotein translocase subunit SecG [Cytophaga hutchinsonii]ABG59092.1 protein translocase subunit secG [Cytophaga hutchinsonii ATCC 33406]SFX37083.1 preprotein translocase subunit SecG [Cytophaga hutchinsonii ATCC 33406]
MIITLSILLILCAVLLVIVVLAQNSKGGVADGFSSSTQVIGAKRTGDFLSNLSIGLAITILVICLAFNYVAKPTVDDADDTDVENTEGTTAPESGEEVETAPAPADTVPAQ